VKPIVLQSVLPTSLMPSNLATCEAMRDVKSGAICEAKHGAKHATV